MAWRIAESLKTLKRQLDAAFPERDRKSDGGIGDAAHASRKSDHNPWVKDGRMGVVTAIDVTHDPEGGVDCHKLAKALTSAPVDPRIKYVIWNAQITQKADKTKWKKYTGPNAHKHHLHISVESDKALYDSTQEWRLGFTQKPPPQAEQAQTTAPLEPAAAPPQPASQQGAAGPDPGAATPSETPTVSQRLNSGMTVIRTHAPNVIETGKVLKSGIGTTGRWSVGGIASMVFGAVWNGITSQAGLFFTGMAVGILLFWLYTRLVMSKKALEVEAERDKAKAALAELQLKAAMQNAQNLADDSTPNVVVLAPGDRIETPQGVNA